MPGGLGKPWNVVAQPRRAGTAILGKSDRFLGARVQAFFLTSASFPFAAARRSVRNVIALRHKRFEQPLIEGRRLAAQRLRAFPL